MHDPKNKPSEQAVDTYELWKEGLYFACEKTIGASSDELASFLAETLADPALDTGPARQKEVVKEACRLKARCDGRAPEEKKTDEPQKGRKKDEPQEKKKSGKKKGEG